MRLLKFINEQSQEDYWDFVKKIKSDCKTFLREKIILYRSIKWNKAKDYFFEMKNQKNRKPKDIQYLIHEILDDLFEKKFGWRVRSEGVPATTSLDQAFIYGKTFLFFPIGKYEYVWNSKIRDLYSTLSKRFYLLSSVDQNISIKDFEMIGFSEKKLKIYLEEIVNEYEKTKIDNSFMGEVFVKCDKYYMLDYYWFLNSTKKRDMKKSLDLIWGK